LTAEGNAGMIAKIHDTPYSIGYVGVSFHEDVAKAGIGTAALRSYDGEFLLPTPQAIEAAAAALSALEPDAIGINCVAAERLAGDLALLARAAPGRPLVAYGNLGLPADGPGWRFTEELEPEAYADEARRWMALGARIVGGCCGTTPAHTRALRAALALQTSPLPPSGGRGPG
ncbi:MAG TPA: homocysteine S-methyltransferase family protein, partial [Thermoanaerobaculia bacterium]